MKLFIDSSAYIAFYNKRDEKHGEAEGFIDEVKRGVFGPVIFCTTDYVFDETVTSIRCNSTLISLAPLASSKTGMSSP